MGSTLKGSAKQKGSAPLMTKEQQDVLNQAIQGLGPQASQAYQQQLQPYDPQQFQDLFQQAFIDPAMLTYEQQVLPAIQQRFVNVGAGSSSALNQALGQSAADLSTMLGSQMGQFYQGQQSNQLQAMQLLNQLLGQKAHEPIIQQRQGLGGPLIGAAGSLGAASMMSSKTVKENFRKFDKGLEELKEIVPQIFDYKKPYNTTNQVGFIAEDVPNEVNQDVDGVLGIQIMGMVAMLVNAVKELSLKVEELEAK